MGLDRGKQQDFCWILLIAHCGVSSCPVDFFPVFYNRLRRFVLLRTDDEMLADESRFEIPQYPKCWRLDDFRPR